MAALEFNRDMKFKLRNLIQLISLLALNSYFGFLKTGIIYRGPLKFLCVPALNCYSCPLAVGSCPLGALQNFIAAFRYNFLNRIFNPGFYVIGFLGIVGSVIGRMQCGWICPFGFLQDLMYKIPSYKVRIPRIFNHLKYVLLFFFVFLLPFFVLDFFNLGEVWFCKFICPAGTLEAAIPILSLEPSLRAMIGWVFYLKAGILVFFLMMMIASRRPFCRTSCPLGAIYGLFNKFSLFKINVNASCKKCNACFKNCPMGLKVYESKNSENCIRCLKCSRVCEFNAVSYGIFEA